jgi:hypothetical protein
MISWAVCALMMLAFLLAAAWLATAAKAPGQAGGRRPCRLGQ